MWTHTSYVEGKRAKMAAGSCGKCPSVHRKKRCKTLVWPWFGLRWRQVGGHLKVKVGHVVSGGFVVMEGIRRGEGEK